MNTGRKIRLVHRLEEAKTPCAAIIARILASGLGRPGSIIVRA
ncbi:MAG: hypothetical protein ACYDAG_09630 [Chloroflexota bacterium]